MMIADSSFVKKSYRRTMTACQETGKCVCLCKRPREILRHKKTIMTKPFKCGTNSVQPTTISGKFVGSVQML